MVPTKLLQRPRLSLVLPVVVTFALLSIWFMIPNPDNTYTLDPAMQLQRFGLVSEDGIIEADKIDSSGRLAEESKDHLYNYFGNGEGDNKGKDKAKDKGKGKVKVKGKESTNDGNSRSRSKNIAKTHKLVGVGSNGNVGTGMLVSNDQVSPQDIQAYKEKMKNSKKGKLTPINNNLLSDDKVLNFIQNGEPEEELTILSQRARKLFLRKVAKVKESMTQ
jgi:hypothetical protein